MPYKQVSRPAWVEVDLGAVRHNMMQVRKKVGPAVKILTMVKANAYGLGAKNIARVVLENGADRLGVVTLEEGVELRLEGIGAPIMVFGFIDPDYIDVALRYNLTQTVYSLEMARLISEKAVEKGRVATIHLKVDTGMGRLGFLPDRQAQEDIAAIFQLPGLNIEGIFSHLADADMQDKESSLRQLRIFDQFLACLEKRGISFAIRHIGASAAVLDMPEAYYDMVRPGIIIYGCYPSEEVRHDEVRLMPALSLKAHIIHIKKVPAHTPISYGGRWVSQRESIIAVLPVGYADGYSRRLAQNGEILLRGQRVPVVGTICMDFLMADVTDISLPQVGEEAVLIGTQGSEEITLDDIAQKLDTISYEISCRLGMRLPRIYING